VAIILILKDQVKATRTGQKLKWHSIPAFLVEAAVVGLMQLVYESYLIIDLEKKKNLKFF